MPKLNVSHFVGENIFAFLKKWFDCIPYEYVEDELLELKNFASGCKEVFQCQPEKENWYFGAPETFGKVLRERINKSLLKLLKVENLQTVAGVAKRHRKYILEAMLVCIVMRETFLKWDLRALQNLWAEIITKKEVQKLIEEQKHEQKLIEEQKPESPKRKRKTTSVDDEDAFAFYIIACEVCYRMRIVPPENDNKKTVWCYALGFLEPICKRYVSGGSPTSATKRRDEIFQIITRVDKKERLRDNDDHDGLREFFNYPALYEKDSPPLPAAFGGVESHFASLTAENIATHTNASSSSASYHFRESYKNGEDVYEIDTVCADNKYEVDMSSRVFESAPIVSQQTRKRSYDKINDDGDDDCVEKNMGQHKRRNAPSPTDFQQQHHMNGDDDISDIRTVVGNFEIEDEKDDDDNGFLDDLMNNIIEGVGYVSEFLPQDSTSIDQQQSNSDNSCCSFSDLASVDLELWAGDYLHDDGTMVMVV